MIPLIKGMMEYKENPVKGVILNRCSKGMYQLMKPEIEEKLGHKIKIVSDKEKDNEQKN